MFLGDRVWLPALWQKNVQSIFKLRDQDAIINRHDAVSHHRKERLKTFQMYRWWGKPTGRAPRGLTCDLCNGREDSPRYFRPADPDTILFLIWRHADPWHFVLSKHCKDGCENTWMAWLNALHQKTPYSQPNHRRQCVVILINNSEWQSYKGKLDYDTGPVTTYWCLPFFQFHFSFLFSLFLSYSLVPCTHTGEQAHTNPHTCTCTRPPPPPPSHTPKTRHSPCIEHYIKSPPQCK